MQGRTVYAAVSWKKINTNMKKSWVVNLIKNVKCVTCFVISEYVESRVMGDRFTGMFRHFLLKVKFRNVIEYRVFTTV